MFRSLEVFPVCCPPLEMIFGMGQVRCYCSTLILQPLIFCRTRYFYFLVTMHAYTDNPGCGGISSRHSSSCYTIADFCLVKFYSWKLFASASSSVSKLMYLTPDDSSSIWLFGAGDWTLVMSRIIEYSFLMGRRYDMVNKTHHPCK